MVSWLVIASALAASGELKVEVDRGTPLTVFVDGAKKGTATRGKSWRGDLPRGLHEVALAYDAKGEWLFCIGEVDLRGNATVEALGRACSGLEARVRTENTVIAGGLIEILGAEAKGAVSVGERQRTLPADDTLIANVAAGTYTVSVATCSGPVTVAAGQKKAVVAAGGACKGFDAAKGGKKKGKKK